MTRMEGGDWCTSTLTHRVWFMNKHILVGNGQAANSNVSCFGFHRTDSVITSSRSADSTETNAPSTSRLCVPIIWCPASYQLAHAALLSHSILTFVMKAHLAGFAAEAVLRRVSGQEHHVLGCCAWWANRKEGNRFRCVLQELDLNGILKKNSNIHWEGKKVNAFQNEVSLRTKICTKVQIWLDSERWV